jgi:hypothetical protein
MMHKTRAYHLAGVGLLEGRSNPVNAICIASYSSLNDALLDSKSQSIVTLCP